LPRLQRALPSPSRLPVSRDDELLLVVFDGLLDLAQAGVGDAGGTKQPAEQSGSHAGPDRHVSGIANPFNGHIDEFRNRARSALRWLDRDHLDSMSDPGAFAAAGAEEQEGGSAEPPPLASAGVLVCLMG
jgi:hypothetical protein